MSTETSPSGLSLDSPAISITLANRFNRSHAVVIGINHYTHGIPSLKTAVNDSRYLGQLLADAHGYQIYSLTSDVTYDAVKTLFTDTLPADIGVDDRLLVYFAGHGIALDGDDGPVGFLIPQDADPNDEATYLRMDMLYAWLDRLPCRHVLVILDCCFAGAFRWVSTRHLQPAPSIVYQERFDRFVRSHAWQALTSAAFDQRAIDIIDGRVLGERGEQKNHSPFAQALFAALQGAADVQPYGRGDGVLTATQLYMYLRDALELPADGRSGYRQTPGLWPLPKHDKGEYVFVVPGRKLELPPAPALTLENNPWRGLEPYTDKERDLFFGRTEPVEDLVKRIRANPLTIVVGASGMGKTSLVQAGVVPALRSIDTPGGDLASSRPSWCILPVVRPGTTPRATLAHHLATQLPDVVESEAGVQAPGTLDFLAQIVTRWRALHPDSRLLLIVDQLEELVTLDTSERERTEFLALLASAVVQEPDYLRIVCIVRSDIEPGFHASPFGASWLSNRWFVPPWQPHELRAVIEEPASARVLFFDPPAIVDALITEVVPARGALPLLSFTLSEMYRCYLARQEQAQHAGEILDRSLTDADYRGVGYAIGALQKRADEEYNALADDAHRDTMQRVLLRMVTDEGGELTRRRVALTELKYTDQAENDRVGIVLDRLIEARLVVPGKNEQDEPYVEPAHDQLVRSWSQLRQWWQAAKDQPALQRRLTAAAEDWLASRGDPRLLWDNNPRLFETYIGLSTNFFIRYWRDLAGSTRSPASWLNRGEQEFVAASIRRRTAQRRLVTSIVAGSFLILAALTAEDGAILLWDAAKLTLDGSPLRSRGPAVYTLAFHPRAPLLLSGGYEQKIRGWDLQRRREQEQSYGGHKLWVTSVVFSPDGSRYISAGDSDTIIAWDTATGTPIGEPQKAHNTGGQPYVEFTIALAYSPDGARFASGGQDGTVILWSSKTGQREGAPLLDHRGAVTALVFSPDGSLLATAGADGQVILWDVEEHRPVTSPLVGKKTPVSTLSFRPDGNEIASGDTQGVVTLWSSKEAMPLNPEGWRHNNAVSRVVFSPDKRLLASSSCGMYSGVVCAQGDVRLWDTLARQPFGIPLKPATGDTPALAWSPDGKILAMGGCNQGAFELIVSRCTGGAVEIWPIGSGTQPDRLATFPGPVYGIAFASDGKELFIASCGENSIMSGGIVGASLNNCSSAQLSRWDIAERKQIGSTLPLLGAVTGVSAVSGSPLLAISSSLSITLIDSETWRVEDALFATGLILNSTALSPDGRYIVASGCIISGTTPCAEGVIAIWDRQNAGAGPQIEQRGYTIFTSLSFDRSGGLITSSCAAGIAGMIGPVPCDGVTQRWRIDNGHLSPSPSELWQGLATDLATSPDGSMLAVGTADRTVLLLDLESGRPIVEPAGHVRGVDDGMFAPDGRLLVTSSSDKVILWDTARSTIIRSFESSVGGQAVALRQNGELVLVGAAGEVRVWDSQLALTESYSITTTTDTAAGSGTHMLFPTGGQRPFLSRSGNLAFQPDCNTLKDLTCQESAVHIYDLVSRQAHDITGVHKSEISALAASDDGSLLVTGGCTEPIPAVNFGDGCHQGEIRLWETATGRLRGAPITAHRAEPRFLAISGDGRRLVSATGPEVLVWDLAGAQRAAALPELPSAVTALAISGDGSLIAIATEDGNLFLWDGVLRRQIGPSIGGFDSTIRLLRFSSDGTLMAGSSGGSVYLRDTSEARWVGRACELAGRNLSFQEWERFFPGESYHLTCPQLKLHLAQSLAQALTMEAAGQSAAAQQFADAARQTAKSDLMWLNNTVCWYGSLASAAADVMPACDRAVELAPGLGPIHDSRGLARALAGDTTGAREDFDIAMDWARKADIAPDFVTSRQRWIADLSAGRNPFTLAELERLRTEDIQLPTTPEPHAQSVLAAQAEGPLPNPEKFNMCVAATQLDRAKQLSDMLLEQGMAPYYTSPTDPYDHIGSPEGSCNQFGKAKSILIMHGAHVADDVIAKMAAAAQALFPDYDIRSTSFIRNNDLVLFLINEQAGAQADIESKGPFTFALCMPENVVERGHVLGKALIAMELKPNREGEDLVNTFNFCVEGGKSQVIYLVHPPNIAPPILETIREAIATTFAGYEIQLEADPIPGTDNFIWIGMNP